MKLDTLDIALWLWTILTITVGIVLILLNMGSVPGTIGVLLIIVGLVSIMPASLSTLGDLQLNRSK